MAANDLFKSGISLIFRPKTLWLPFLFGTIALLPPFLKLYSSYLLNWCLTYFIAVMGLNLILGYAGQVSLAQGAFMGIGAYTVALLTTKAGFSFWLALPLATLITFVLGMILGFPALRVKTHYLAMVTVGFAVIIYQLALHGGNFTGGPYGIKDIPRPTLWTIHFDSDLAYSYFLIVASLIMTGLMYWILNSRWGKAFKSIRENEIRAEMLGVNLRNYKLVAFAIGSAFAGVAGGLLAPLLGYIDPTTFDVRLTFDLLLMLIIGGTGRFEGPLIGVPLVLLGPELLRIAPMLYSVIFASVAIFILLFMPKGMVSLWDWGFKRVTGRGAPELTK